MRLIQLAVLVAGLGFFTPTAVAQNAIVSLFDGRTLSGWNGDPELWSVEDGAITGQTTAEKPIKDNSFLIWKGEELTDFELRLKFRIEGGNSGVQYRCQDHGNFQVGGYQADIDSGMRYIGILYDELGRGILAERGKRVVWEADGKAATEDLDFNHEQFEKSYRPTEWNEYIIRANGNHQIQILNGIVVVDFTDNDEANRDLSGYLALQIHSGPAMKVQFKDITLTKPLPASATAADVSGCPPCCCECCRPTRATTPAQCCGGHRRLLRRFCR